MPSLKHLKAVVFDWAGTVVDHGSLAPMGVFVETFAEFGVSITVEEARVPMGMAKRPHIAALMAMPRVAKAWKAARGNAPTEADIDALYDVFVPKNRAIAAKFADLTLGVAWSTELRDKSTGYSIKLNSIPVGEWDGTLMLLPPFAEREEEPTRQLDALEEA